MNTDIDYIALKKENEELKNKLLQMEEDKKHLQSIYDVAPIGIFIFDENTVITHCNDFFVQIIGSKRELLIGLNMRENLKDKKLLDKIELALKNGSAYYEGVYQSITADKSTPVKILFKRFNNESIYVIGIASDISDEYRYRNELQSKIEAIETANTNINSLLDASPDIICFKDGAGRWLEANNADLELFDLLGKDYRGKTDIDLIEYSPFFKEAFETCVVTDELAWKNKVVSREVETITKSDGTEKVYDVIKKPVFNPDGSRKALIVLGRDITEMKKSQKLLIENKEQLDFLMDNIPGMVYKCLLDPTYSMQYVSKGAYELTGYHPETFLNTNVTFNLLIMPEMRQKVWNDINSAISRNESFKLKYKIKDKNGKIKWVFENGRVVGKDEKGTNILEGIIYDITAQEELQEKLKKSEQKYRAIIEKSQDAVFIMDPAGNIKEANDSACKMLGYTIDEIKELTYRDVVDIHEQKDTLITLNKMRKNIPVQIYEKHFRTSTGEIIPVEVSVALIKDSDEQELIISIVRDISDRKRNENELRRAKEKAEESDRLKSAFLANMSHEIRTPMNGILGFSQLLKDSEITKEEFDEYLSIIISNSQHLLKLIDDIINIAKIEANQIEINIYKFDVNNILKELETLFRNDITLTLKKDLELINDKSGSEGHCILSDATRIKQIMNNLIKNAVKFTEKGFVKFGYEVKGNMIEFYVKDTGIGIPKHMQNAVFDRFTQLDNPLSARAVGTGLGLAISKGLVETMGGHIRLESEIEKGSTFYFSLPYNKTQSDGFKEREELSSLLINWEDKTVLIAEDNPTNFILLERMLRPTKINIIRVVNGREAIDVFTEKQKLIDAILMDIKMPVLDGYKATEEIRKFDKNIPVIAVTAYAMHGDKKKSELAGCDDYLPKPLSKETLMKVLSRFL
jgi:PAS domain S-box-containing protein